MLIGEKCKDITVLFCWATNHNVLQDHVNSELKKHPDKELIGIDLTTGKYTKKEINTTQTHEGSFLVTMSVVKKEE